MEFLVYRHLKRYFRECCVCNKSYITTQCYSFPPRLLAERKVARATCLFSFLVCILCIERLQLIASGQPASYEPAAGGRPPHASISDINHGKHTFPFHRMLTVKCIFFAALLLIKRIVYTVVKLMIFCHYWTWLFGSLPPFHMVDGLT